MRCFQLKARELKHPNVRERSGRFGFTELRDSIRSDVARSNCVQSRCRSHFGGKRCRRRFAVCAGNADDFGSISLRTLQIGELLRKKLNLADDRNARFAR